MRIIYGIKKIIKYPKPVVAIGVFDGVHRGHRNILKAAVSCAHRIGGTSIVLTFFPHPQKEESLYSLEHRLRLIRELDVDVCVVINFTGRFAEVSAFDFIKNILVKKIKPHSVYVGKNFRFGKNAQGDLKTLDEFSRIYNFKLKAFEVIKVKNQPVSSTFIRALIKQGKLNAAQRLLTRPVSVLGTVIRGSSLGRKLGFPTANINPHHEVIPPRGVYIVRIIFNAQEFKGICYIGTKPTFKNKRPKIHIEVYILNFQKNIYGKYLEIQFIRRIRQERKFTSVQRLISQIKEDIKTLK